MDSEGNPCSECCLGYRPATSRQIGPRDLMHSIVNIDNGTVL